MLNLFSIILLVLLSATSYAVINGAAVTVSGTTLCNNGTIDKTFAGTMTTTCGSGWAVGSVDDIVPPPAGLLFETNFANDGAFDITNQSSTWTAIGANKPEGFNGALIEGNGRIYGVPGAGLNGTTALKMEWDPALGQPVTQLYLHLTGDKASGHNEVFVRYNVKLPNDLQISNPLLDDIPYWKWGRLWQNTGPTAGDAWTENRADSGYAVWNFGGTATYGLMNKFTYAAATGSNLSQGSAGGERYSMDWYNGIPADPTIAPGYFNAVGAGAWDFNKTTRQLVDNTTQSWHTLEWRFRLSSSPTANDGVMQLWFDGVEQTPPIDIGPGGGAPELGADLAPNEIPTPVIVSGYNMLVLFDNMAYWNENWSEAGIGNGLFVNDIVVSTARIGHSYTAGSVSP